jgi:hypothetical protein
LHLAGSGHTGADPSAAALSCDGPVFITSLANGRIVSAELGYGGGDNGMLRARATAIGPWEQFE